MSRIPVAKGTVPFGPYRTWYRVTGRPGSGLPPIVVLHGGPGSTHDYLLSLGDLAELGHPVVHYDQLGNGGSTHLPGRGADFWTVRLFLDELANLLGSLRIDGDYILFGHSWGGMLAAEHAAARPAGLRGLVIANAPASYVLWRQEMKVLRERLPREVDAVLARHEAAGTTGSDEYLQAMDVFYERHVCRVRPRPREFVATTMEVHNDPTVYHTMNGPSEFHVVGTLKDWSVEASLPRIAVPTLVLSGRHDEATPATVRPFRDLVPDVRWRIFEESSHGPHLEEKELFDAVMADFLTSLA